MTTIQSDPPEQTLARLSDHLKDHGVAHTIERMGGNVQIIMIRAGGDAYFAINYADDGTDWQVWFYAADDQDGLLINERMTDGEIADWFAPEHP